MTKITLAALVVCGIARAQFVQQGGKLIGAGAAGNGRQGNAVALSADGNTLLVGAPDDNGARGAVYVYTRANGAWLQQGGKLVGTGADNAMVRQGASVAISADGNTAVVGTAGDGRSVTAWIFTRGNGVWSQQGPKLAAADATGIYYNQPEAVAISSDGNTVAVGADFVESGSGGVWIFARSGGGWSQQGGKLSCWDAAGPGVNLGSAVALSGDGSTLIAGGQVDNNTVGAAWIFTRASGGWGQQGPKLVGAGAEGAALEGNSVAISQDGNTAVVGGFSDASGTGASWIFTRTGGGVWVQQGLKLSGAGARGKAILGGSVAITADGNDVLLGGPGDSNQLGAAWRFRRAEGGWSSLGSKLTGTGGLPDGAGGGQGTSVALSADGATAAVGAPADSGGAGAVWIFVTAPAPVAVAPALGTGATQSFTFTFSDAAGWQDIQVANVLIANGVDGRQPCYVAFAGGTVSLIDEAGGLSSVTLPGSAMAQNNQCSINAAGSSFSGSGTTLTLNLAMRFAPGFAGNKVVYLASGNGVFNSGWQALGVWKVPGGGAASGPAVGGMAPARSAGYNHTYTFTFSSATGVNILMNSVVDGRQGCYVVFVPSAQDRGTLFLVDDGGDSGGPFTSMPVPATAGNTVGNSLCTIDGGASSMASAGSTMSLTLAITFSPAFTGNQVIYASARNGLLDSGWQAVGSISVRSDDPAAPTVGDVAVAVNPSGTATLVVGGGNFQSDGVCAAACGVACPASSVINFGHVDLPTQPGKQPGQLQAMIPASLLTVARTVDVTVRNPIVIECQGSESHVSPPASFVIPR